MNVLLTIITRTTLIIAFLLVLTAGVVTIPPKLSQMRGLERERNDLLRRIDHKKNEIKVLKEKQQRFKTDPEFVEHIARQNKRVCPGELVFVFDSEDAK
ncbi:MAG TPA: septum formation initiator family protein [Kiritimatiellia bacterium]|nr:septum formation initiator family protein [Kiritimatiellia bacterium]HPS07512.1 septum formation initiator family protein [Kiritimatiellia bacterium]